MPLPMALKKTAQKYAEMMESGQLLSNRRAIDVIDGRMMELLERMDDPHEAPERMANLYRMWQERKEAMESGSENEVRSLEREMDKEFERAYHDYKAWEQAMEVLDLRRKMVDSEIKTIKEMKAILTAEQAYNLVAKLMAICIREVKDHKTLKRINAGFSRLIGENKLHEPVEVVEAVEDEDYV